MESKIITVRVPCVIRGEEAARLQAEADREQVRLERAEARKRDQAWGEAMADRPDRPRRNGAGRYGKIVADYPFCHCGAKMSAEEVPNG